MIDLVTVGGPATTEEGFVPERTEQLLADYDADVLRENGAQFGREQAVEEWEIRAAPPCTRPELRHT